MACAVLQYVGLPLAAFIMLPSPLLSTLNKEKPCVVSHHFSTVATPLRFNLNFTWKLERRSAAILSASGKSRLIALLKSESSAKWYYFSLGKNMFSNYYILTIEHYAQYF